MYCTQIPRSEMVQTSNKNTMPYTRHTKIWNSLIGLLSDVWQEPYMSYFQETWDIVMP